ncbi:MAG TPA: DUF2269 family protein [Solirubrobacter sp.]|nr:DUF2269 family protein [Solirubrobacter sp.]
MFADISLYSISVWIHVSAAVVGLGSTFALAVGFPLAQRLDARYMPFIHHLSEALNSRLAGPAMGLILITGIYQVIDGPWSFSDAWISATFVIVIALGALQGAYFTRTDRRLAAMAEKELAAGATTLSDDYNKQAQREGSIGALAGLLIVAAVFLMVTKPGA